MADLERPQAGWLAKDESWPGTVMVAWVERRQGRRMGEEGRGCNHHCGLMHDHGCMGRKMRGWQLEWWCGGDVCPGQSGWVGMVWKVSLIPDTMVGNCQGDIMGESGHWWGGRHLIWWEHPLKVNCEAACRRSTHGCGWISEEYEVLWQQRPPDDDDLQAFAAPN